MALPPGRWPPVPFRLLSSRFDLYNIGLADLVIKPDLADMKWSDFKEYRHAMEKGMEIARERLPEIRRVRSKKYHYQKRVGRWLGYRGGDEIRVSPEEYVIR